MGFSFENLDVYNKAIDFVNDVYSLTRTFPKDEMFGLTSQLRRAAVSVPLNISEGRREAKKILLVLSIWPEGRFSNVLPHCEYH